jgi:Uma2 family endonuclease
MSQTAPGFSDLTQEPFGEIPTEPEAFMRWGTTLDRSHPYKYELSNGKVSRMMIQVSRAHWLVTANILGELLQKVDRDRFQAGPAEFGVRTGIGVRYPDVIVDQASDRLETLACEAPVLIVEVLSPSTSGLDFTAKLQEYTHLLAGRAAGMGMGAPGRRIVAEAAEGARRAGGDDCARRPRHRARHVSDLSRHPRRADPSLIPPHALC